MSQSQENLRKWQSPPDPSTNHNIAGNRQHEGTSKWFIDSDKFCKWMEAGALLWIHGKGTFLSFVTSVISWTTRFVAGSGKSILWFVVPQICTGSIGKLIIVDYYSYAIIKGVKARMASIAYFYFDFRDDDKKSCRNLLSSLLVQLSACSDAFRDILSRYYVVHDNGACQASDKDMTQCLKEMLTLPEQCPVYLIMDALDECPDTSGVPSAREQVLDLIKELVSLQLPGLHICVTSRPEVDISDALGSLVSQTVSLQDELGQKKDIAGYVRSAVYHGSNKFMKRWRREDKEHVIKTLSEKADGM